MAETLTSLCSVLLKEYFGEIVQKVGTFLMKQVSSCPLYLIVRNVSLPLSKVKSALCVLIQHNFCDFTEDDKEIIEYTVKKEYVLRLLHYEKYAHCALLLYGDNSHFLVEEVLNNGKLTMSEAILKVVERLQEDADCSAEDLANKFRLMIVNQYLIRCPYPHPNEDSKSKSQLPNLSVSESELFRVPEINLQLLEGNSSEEPEAKRKKTEFPDSEMYWRVNFDRFQQFLRDEAIITACANHFDAKSAKIVKTLLSESDLIRNIPTATTNPVQYFILQEKLNDSKAVEPQELDGLLSNLCEGTQSFVSKADDRGSGMFVVNIVKVLRRLVEDMAASVVQDGLGSKCARIFRILLEKKVLDPKQIEEIAMLHPKDTKEYIFKMLKEKYITVHELPKGSDFSHGQSYYFLKIDMNQVCRMMLDRCYQALLNLIVCNEVQIEENKRLLEKKQKIDAIVASLRQEGAEEEHIEEVQQCISEPENAVIEKVLHVTEKIDTSQIQLAEMVSVLNIWLKYCKLK